MSNVFEIEFPFYYEEAAFYIPNSFNRAKNIY